MVIDNRGEEIMENNSLTKERLFEIAQELIQYVCEAVGNDYEAYSTLSNCIGLTDTEIEALTYGELTGDEDEEDS